MRLSVQERFLEKVVPEPNTGCWLWLSHVDSDGYSRLSINNISILAHRYSYEHHNGAIPEELEIDHLCSVRSCVNPEHLEAVTHLENMNRMRVRGRHSNGREKITHCPKGHPYAGENLYVYRGQRGCKKCRYETNRQRALRKKALASSATIPSNTPSQRAGGL